jgi:transcriptional regulator with XRE-family HTH domain
MQANARTNRPKAHLAIVFYNPFQTVTRKMRARAAPDGATLTCRFDELIRLCNPRVSLEREALTWRRRPVPDRLLRWIPTSGKRYAPVELFLQMSQTDVADVLGVTFQPIQKYERGANRVGASRLQQFSDALGVSPFYFFEGAPTVGKKAPAPNEGELSENKIVSFLGTREGVALVRGFLAIKQKPIRRALIDFIGTFT